MNRRASVLAVALAFVAIPTLAEAQDQPWLKDRRYTEGIGYRVGDLEIHPGIGAEFGYDSNYLHRASDESPIGSLRLRVTPSLSLSTLSKERREATPGGSTPDFEFRAGVSATYNEFFPVSGGRNTTDRDALRQQRNLGGNLDVALNILPQRPWSGTVYGGVTRLITPSPDGLTEFPGTGLSSVGFNRILPRAGAEFIWTPGSGLFDWRLGYHFSGTFFENSNASRLNSIQNRVQTRGRWRFLPRTALMYDGKFDFVTYPGPDGGNAEKSGAHPVRAMIGLNGLVSSSFSLLALAGWGASFYTPAKDATPVQDFNSVIGQLELKWYITPNASSDPAAVGLALSTLSVGFTRDFFDSYIGTYAERDRGYANLSYFFGGRFFFQLEGGVAPIVYPAIPSFKLDSFTDIRVDASLFGEYRLQNAFGLNTTLRYNQNISSTSIKISTTPTPDNLNWSQFEAYLGARWLM
jgi:hypothetical protein